jgi:hypothetical protein
MSAKTEIEKLKLSEMTCRQALKEIAKMCVRPALAPSSSSPSSSPPLSSPPRRHVAPRRARTPAGGRRAAERALLLTRRTV